MTTDLRDGKPSTSSRARSDEPRDAGWPRLHLVREQLLDIKQAEALEWLEVDHRGGYAMGNPLLCPARRYHGLLVAPWGPAGKRHLFLSRFEESAHIGARRFDLSVARYPGCLRAEGLKHLSAFELAPWPRWRYWLGGATLTREIMRVPGTALTLCRYTLSGIQQPAVIELRPLLACREADALTFENLELQPIGKRTAGGVAFQPYAGLPPVCIQVDGRKPDFDPDPTWYRQIEYRLDLERGYDGHEDLFCPGALTLMLEPDTPVVVALSLEAPEVHGCARWDRLADRRRAADKQLPKGFEGDLVHAAQQFLYRDAAGRSGVLAGFPWFGEWGRDTLISLPGLLLSQGHVARMGEALRDLVGWIDGGLLPNIFGPTRESSHYGSVDAALWYARAVDLFDAAGGDSALLLDVLRPALEQIAEGYLAGGRLGIHVGADGLVAAGHEGLNPTWMDAQVDGVPVTPRAGKAVEINALWYLLLDLLEDLSRRAGDDRAAERWRLQRRRSKRGFLAAFWRDETGYLADRVQAEQVDASIRPNMVIAAALARSPLTRKQRAAIMAVADHHLLTPCGLRTLSPEDPDYVGRYCGATWERDHAYHQGTVWPWLLGFWAEAHMRSERPTRALRLRIEAGLRRIEPHLMEAGLLQVSEVFDGDAPHHPGGTPAQAWSVAEILRALVLLRGRP